MGVRELGQQFLAFRHSVAAKQHFFFLQEFRIGIFIYNDCGHLIQQVHVAIVSCRKHLHPSCINHGHNVAMASAGLLFRALCDALQRARGDDRDAERVGHAFGGGYADAQTCVGAWPDADHNALQVGSCFPVIAQYLVDERKEVLGVGVAVRTLFYAQHLRALCQCHRAHIRRRLYMQ